MRCAATRRRRVAAGPSSGGSRSWRRSSTGTRAEGDPATGGGPGARPARAGDLGELAALHRLAVAAASAARGGELLVTAAGLDEPLEASLDVLVADERALVLAGTFDEAVVGYALAALAEHGARTIASVRALFVEPAARGVGVGECLLEGVVAWGQGHGCAGVDVSALPGDRATKSFLEGAGFRARLLVMHRERSS